MQTDTESRAVTAEQSAAEHLQEALDASGAETKNYHIRQSLQLLIVGNE